MYYDKQIRYIDYLENEEKQRNCGYVKMTVTDSLLLLEMQVKGLYETDDVASEVTLAGVGVERGIGSIMIRQGSGSFRWEYKDPLHVGEELVISEGLCYGKLEQVRVQLSPRRSLRCVWREGISGSESVKRRSEYTVQANGTVEMKPGDALQASGTVEMEPGDALQVNGAVETEPGDALQINGTVDTGLVKRTAEQSVGNREKAGKLSRPDLAVIRMAEEAGEPQVYDNLMMFIPKAEATNEINIAGEDMTKNKVGEGVTENSTGEYVSGNKTGEGVTESRTGECVSRNKVGEYISGNKTGEGVTENRPEQSVTASMSGEDMEEMSQINRPGMGNFIISEEGVAGNTIKNLTEDSGRSENKNRSKGTSRSQGKNEAETPVVLHNHINSDAKNVMEMAELHQVSQTPQISQTSRTPHMVSMCEDKWQQLQKIYPHVRPFQDEREYLSLGPEDFVVLHSSAYQLVQNSFLLHGYFNYHHLILTQVSQRNGSQFYIGVPGNFYEKEKQVAIMYGFGSFECRQEPAQEGDFGYYMIKVEL